MLVPAVDTYHVPWAYAFLHCMSHGSVVYTHLRALERTLDTTCLLTERLIPLESLLRTTRSQFLY